MRSQKTLVIAIGRNEQTCPKCGKPMSQCTCQKYKTANKSR